jgi:DNA polymerase
MRRAVEAIAEELRRLKASGVTAVPVSEDTLALLRRAAASRRAPGQAAKPAASPARPEAPQAPAEQPKRAPKRPPADPGQPLPPPPVVSLPPGTKQERWDALLGLVRLDTVCASRVRPGKKVVLGVGSLDADIMFVGEAPGAEEEVQGEPFVGPAGQLLTKMIGAMALSRPDVYIGNIMNWRPDMPVGADGVQAGNRPPTEAEIAHCMPYLCAQVSIVEPKILVALGATAARGLLGPRSFEALGEVRGRWHQFDGRPLMVTYHPSYILRNPINRMKRLIWEDLLKVMERAKLPVTDKQRGYFLS